MTETAIIEGEFEESLAQFHTTHQSTAYTSGCTSAICQGSSAGDLYPVPPPVFHPITSIPTLTTERCPRARTRPVR